MTAQIDNLQGSEDIYEGPCIQCSRSTRNTDVICEECRGNITNARTTDITDLSCLIEQHNSFASRTFSNQITSIYNSHTVNRTDSLGLGNLLSRTYSQHVPYFRNWSLDEQDPLPNVDHDQSHNLLDSVDPFIESTISWNNHTQTEQLPILSSQYSLEDIPIVIQPFAPSSSPDQSEPEVIESSDAGVDARSLPLNAVDSVDEWNVGSLLIDELCNALNVLRSNIRDASHTLYDLVSKDQAASFDHFKHLWIGSSPRLVNEIKTESSVEAKAAREAAITFEQQPQRFAHAECIAAYCFHRAFNEDTKANQSMPSQHWKPRRPLTSTRSLLTTDVLCEMMRSTANGSMHTTTRLERYQALTESIASSKMEPVVPLIDQVLQARPLLVEACKPSFLDYTKQFSFNADTLDLAIAILNRAVQLGIAVRRNHNSLSAAAIFLAASLEAVGLTQYEFCRKVNLTEVTLRKVIREFGQVWNQLVPARYTPKTMPHFLAKQNKLLASESVTGD